jgi:hypothetical protein
MSRDDGQQGKVLQTRTCRYCSEEFRPHPGYADHEDRCDLNPMNRQHIVGEAVAMYGVSR